MAQGIKQLPNTCEVKSSHLGAGEMAQRLRALTALPEVLSSIPSNHMVAPNIYNSIWYPLLACIQNTVFVINKSFL